MDVGALCYLRREATSGHGPRRADGGRKVELSSLCQKRVGHMRALITHISDQVRHGAKRANTLHNLAQHFARFLTWADENGHSTLLDSDDAARRAIAAYADHTRERVTTHSISRDYGAVLQRGAFRLMEEFLGVENLTRGVNLLRKNSDTKATVPPSEASQVRTLLLCEALFDGLTALVLDAKPYPCQIGMPPHLGYPDNKMWVIPTAVWCMPLARLDAKDSFGVFNYREGRLTTAQETIAMGTYYGKRKRYREMFNAGQRLLDSANGDSRHWHRRFMGVMALNAFIALFLSRTGMNWEQAVELRWRPNDNDTVSTIRQKFRSIKHRAGGKEVYFQLPLKFMPVFKRFLQLRDYLLKDYPGFDRLFFTMGNRSVGLPTAVRSSLFITSQFLKRIDPTIDPITSRAWRAAKSDWLISRTDVSTTAQLLQSSERTVLTSYAAGTVAAHQGEMTAFLDRIVLDSGTTLTGSSNGAVGACTSFGNPREISGAVALVKPNCANPEVGCLFCDKFKVHSDEIDVRKLLSCRYCLSKTSHLARFHAQSGPLIERIQLILGEVHRRDPSLVPRIEQEVKEGELDPYWASKYDMLLRLRLINDSE